MCKKQLHSTGTTSKAKTKINIVQCFAEKITVCISTFATTASVEVTCRLYCPSDKY